jgi:diguanylate cyclase (GGDEF)-like protein/PAS domain S-box-containing protein
MRMGFSNELVPVVLALAAALVAACAVLAALLVNRQKALRVARSAEAGFRDLYESISEGVFRSTLDGRMLSANPALVQLNGYASEAEMIADVNDIAGSWYVQPGRRAEIHALLLRDGKVSRIVSEVMRYKTRERIWIEETTRLVRDPATGEPRYYEGTVREVTDTVERLELQERYEKIASVISGCIYQQRMAPDGSFSIPYASAGMKQILGVSPAEVKADFSVLSALAHPDDRQALFEGFRQSAANMTPRSSEYRIRTPDGVEKWVSGHSVPERQADGSVIWHGFFTDISERKRTDEQVYALAFRDTLTGLPNRAALLRGLDEALGQAVHTGRRGAVLFIDLDQFKVLNDTKGHHFGDRLLVDVAQRLTPLVGSGDLVARLGGDEFVIMLRGLDPDAQRAEQHVRRIVERIHAAMAAPFVLDGFPFRTTASVGVALFHGTEVSADELLRRADMAMYEAKAASRGGVAFFAAEMQVVLEERLTLTTDFREALEHGGLELAYQPQVDDDGVWYGAEALLRWTHPTRGAIPPSVFIPLVERAGLGSQVDGFVLQAACATLRRWQLDPATGHLEMAVNIGSQRLDTGLVALVTNALKVSGADPSCLTLEITERVILDKVGGIDSSLFALKKLGVKIALDDFGTGYSSLSHLKRLPLDALKIDCSFVRDVETDPNDRVIVQTILNIARNLGVTAIAEGVETEMQALLLRRFGCHAFQGFLYGRPMSRDDFEGHLFTSTDGGRRAILSPTRLVL